jgi:hypothetical protein
MDYRIMSIKEEKEKILNSIDPKIQKALQDGKPHRIEIEIKHSKLSNIKVVNRKSKYEWIDDNVKIRQI